MGNYRFRLSDMMPNAWFYKLRDMGRASRKPSLSHASKKAHPARTGGSSTPKHLPPPQPPAKHHCYQPGRASYYFPSGQEKLPSSPVHPRASDTLFPVDSPRCSKKKPRRKHARPSTKLVSSSSSSSSSSSVSSGCSCRATVGSTWKTEATPKFPPAPESPPHPGGGGGGADDDDDYEGLPCSDKPIIAEHYHLDGGTAWSRSCSCRFTSSATDIILDVASKRSSSATRMVVEEEEEQVQQQLLGLLPPILTKPTKREAALEDAMSVVGSKEIKNRHRLEQRCAPPKEVKSPTRRSQCVRRSQGLRMRSGSPRVASPKKIQAQRRRKGSGPTPRRFLSESLAVVKSSSDPQRDFRDSMLEMIVENNIRASKDLEDLLACYLSLNSNEYHDVIVKVFQQIWFDLTNIRP